MAVLFITGATSGIGLQLALDHQKAGWQVIACGRNQTKLAELNALGMQTLCFDVTNPGSLKQALEQGDITQVDRLILNAGICEYVEQGEVTGELMERTFTVNLIAPVKLLELLLPLLTRSNRPEVAFISSASVYLPFVRAEAYGASKAALRYLSQVLHNSLKSKGVHVATVILGFIDTPLTQKNDFAMPGLASVEGASDAIIKGLAKQKAEISYPKLFCGVLSLLEKLPLSFKLKLAARMVKANTKESV